MRIWLSRWEWACCGDPFEVGSRVRLRVRHGVREEHAAELGPDLGDTIDAVETHHDDEPLPEVVGVVTGIHVVHFIMTTTQVPRPVRPHRPRPDLGGGFTAGSPARPFITTQTPAPGTARLQKVDRLPWKPPVGDRGGDYVIDLLEDVDEPAEDSAL